MSRQRLTIRHHYYPHSPWTPSGGGLGELYPEYTIVVSEQTRTVGVAVCSKNDRYSKKRGVQLARRRMLNQQATQARRTMGEEDWLVVAPRLKYSKERDVVGSVVERIIHTYGPDNITVMRVKVNV